MKFEEAKPIKRCTNCFYYKITEECEKCKDMNKYEYNERVAAFFKKGGDE